MSKKLKAVESSIQPNHKEAELWVTPTNNDGSKEVKYWNNKSLEWSECSSGNNGGDDDGYWYIRHEDHIKLPNSIKETIFYSYTLMKERNSDGSVRIAVLGMAFNNEPIAYGLPVNTVICDNGMCGTLLSSLEELYPDIHNIPRMTKEEFYSLT